MTEFTHLRRNLITIDDNRENSTSHPLNFQGTHLIPGKTGAGTAPLQVYEEV
jgi:hypothetical protein